MPPAQNNIAKTERPLVPGVLADALITCNGDLDKLRMYNDRLKQMTRLLEPVTQRIIIVNKTDPESHI